MNFLGTRETASKTARTSLQRTTTHGTTFRYPQWGVNDGIMSKLGYYLVTDYPFTTPQVFAAKAGYVSATCLATSLRSKASSSVFSGSVIGTVVGAI